MLEAGLELLPSKINIGMKGEAKEVLKQLDGNREHKKICPISKIPKQGLDKPLEVESSNINQYSNEVCDIKLEDLDDSVVENTEIESPFNVDEKSYIKETGFSFKEHKICTECFDDTLGMYVYLDELDKVYTCGKYEKFIMMHKSKIRQCF